MQKKLSLNEELIATFGNPEQGDVYGGGSNTPQCGDISQVQHTICSCLVSACLPCITHPPDCEPERTVAGDASCYPDACTIYVPLTGLGDFCN